MNILKDFTINYPYTTNDIKELAPDIIGAELQKTDKVLSCDVSYYRDRITVNMKKYTIIANIGTYETRIRIIKNLEEKQ